jgi:N-acetyl-alpha-D-muramate 1-phosphate uridylyltransferase
MLPVAILAGGLATRLRPLSDNVPKSLVTVRGRPFIDYQLELLRYHGVQEVVLCVGHLEDQIRSHVGDGRAFGIRVEYSLDGDRPQGTAGALVKARDKLGDAFMVLNGDTYLDLDHAALAAAFRDGGRLGLMVVFHNRGRGEPSNVQFAGGRIVSYDKREPHPDAEHIDAGIGVLRAEALDLVPPGRPADLAALHQELLDRDQLDTYETDHRHYEIGSPEGLADFTAQLEKARA